MPWFSLKPVPGLLDPALRAPVPAPEEDAPSYGDALGALLADLEIPEGTREAAVSTGGILLHGAQEVLRLCNRLAGAESSRDDAREAGRDLLRRLMVLFRERSASYVLEQVAGVASTLRPRPAREAIDRLPRRKDLMTHLEAATARLGISSRMDAPRLAALLVHLDDLYDDASVQIQRLHRLGQLELEPARARTPELLERLHRDFATASLADHLVAGAPGSGPGDPGRHDGLFAVLPEIVELLT